MCTPTRSTYTPHPALGAPPPQPPHLGEPPSTGAGPCSPWTPGRCRGRLRREGLKGSRADRRRYRRRAPLPPRAALLPPLPACAEQPSPAQPSRAAGGLWPEPPIRGWAARGEAAPAALPGAAGLSLPAAPRDAEGSSWAGTGGGYRGILLRGR